MQKQKPAMLNTLALFSKGSMVRTGYASLSIPLPPPPKLYPAPVLTMAGAGGGGIFLS